MNMRQFLFSLVVALMTITTGKAQNTLVAVLSHENSIQTFYGSSALINAVDAAVSGDVITLSAGTFGCAKITKGITIRGNGAEGDSRTTIGISDYANYSISIPSEDTNPFSMECVNVNISSNSSYPLTVSANNSGLNFIKCIVSSGLTINSAPSNTKLINCSISSLSLNGSSAIKLSNCYVRGFTNASGETSKAEFFNCYIPGTFGSLHRCSFVNCLLYDTDYSSGGSGILSSDNSLMNCVLIRLSGGNQTDCYTASVAQVFASYENTLVDPRYGGIYANVPTSLELSDEAKATYLGTDDKEVGLYGGQYPYDFTPTYPRITTLNVAKQATADNKLSVEIEVSATE